MSLVPASTPHCFVNREARVTWELVSLSPSYLLPEWERIPFSQQSYSSSHKNMDMLFHCCSYVHYYTDMVLTLNLPPQLCTPQGSTIWNVQLYTFWGGVFKA